MKNFDEFCCFLRKSTNFASSDNFEEKLAIIKETLKVDEHKIFVEEAFSSLLPIYEDLQELEKVELLDLLQERSYGRTNQKR